MKIAIVGANGMLGRDLTACLKASGHDVSALGRDQVDITQPGTYSRMPCVEWVVNCAAYTNVDGAESDPAGAEAINAFGPENLARWSNAQGSRFLQVSTDYVFDGTTRTPYVEESPVNPLGVYAKTKELGEQRVRQVTKQHIIARTQGLFGMNGKNFVSTILGVLKKDQPLRVVNDQWTCPTYSVDLARSLLSLMSTNRTGTVHVSSEGSCSWYELACFIRDALGKNNPIEPVDTAAFPRPAPRPAYSVLDKKRLSEWTGSRLPDWKVAVSAYLHELGERQMQH